MNSLLSEGLARVFCSSKASICWHSAFFMLQLLHLYMITGLKVQSKGAGKALFPLLAFLASLQPSGDCWGSLVFLGLWPLDPETKKDRHGGKPSCLPIGQAAYNALAQARLNHAAKSAMTAVISSTCLCDRSECPFSLWCAVYWTPLGV